MNITDREKLYRLFRENADVLGTNRITIVALQSFINAVKLLRCKDKHLLSQYAELIKAIKNTQPRIIPLIHLIEQFETEIKAFDDASYEEIKNQTIRILKQKMILYESITKEVIQVGRQYVRDNDIVITHSASTVVKRVLIEAKKELKRKFSVIILKQDFLKTKQMITWLTEAGIDYIVVPEYSLSLLLGKATKMFIGAVSVTHDKQAVAVVGTANVVSFCHINNIPVYLFVKSLKFSHQSHSHQHIYLKEVDMEEDGYVYHLTTHSHDLIDLKLVDHLITENGEVGIGTL
ncbi:MAG: translation initiation factor eIF-2B [Candidatus Scalindua sp.]|nr:translation initiation factor eIF-2B [Candidatus Scalindua sp.]